MDILLKPPQPLIGLFLIGGFSFITGDASPLCPVVVVFLSSAAAAASAAVIVAVAGLFLVEVAIVEVAVVEVAVVVSADWCLPF